MQAEPQETTDVGAYAIDTLRQGVRTPAPWLLVALGVLAGWAGIGLAILALGESETQTPGIVLGTAHAFGALTTLWLLARALDQDHASSLCIAADCTRPGAAGRLAGRWLGASLAGAVAGAVVGSVLQALAPGRAADPLQLYTTNIVVAAQVGAWGLLLATVWRGGLVVLAGLLLWGLGHLPWGAPGFLEGGGAAIGALLPGPSPAAPSAVSHLASAAAAAAVLLAALAVGGKATARG